MYTAQNTPLGRLRGYERELTALYVDALEHRRWGEARDRWARRRQVRYAIRRAEEWQGDPTPLTLRDLGCTAVAAG